MAHEIEINAINGEASFAFNEKNGLPWHKLGTAFDRPMTAEEAIKACHADFEVEGRAAAGLTAEQLEAVKRGEPVKIDISQIADNLFLNSRTDNNYTLGAVKSRYEIVQNSKAFEFIDYLTTGELGTKASIDCAGVLRNGKQIFVTAKFDKEIIAPTSREDFINMYAVFTTGHDNTTPVSCMITPIRVVCNNTLNAAFHNNRGRINFRHTATVNSKLIVNEANIRHAASCLNILEEYSKTFVSGLEQLANKSITEEQALNMIKFVFAPENTRKELVKNAYDVSKIDASTAYKNKVAAVTQSLFMGIGQKEISANNGLWLYNGVTTALQNSLSFRNETRKFEELLDGASYARTNELVDMILAA